MVAAKPQATAGTAPVRTAGTRGAVPVPPAAPPGRSRRTVPLTPMRQQAAKSMRRLAEGIQRDHPELAVHDHVRDAARTLESGNEEASQRHLRAAMFSLTPHSLMRNGVHDDEGHISARQAVHGVHRHLLLVKDIADVAAKNQAAIRRDSYGDYESGPSLPHSPVHADPNAGYGPGALAQKPTQRQPGGDRALNAPDRTNSGGSDPNVADPVGPQPKGSKQFARTWDELGRVIELNWAAWDAGHDSGAGQKAHDTASATASATAKRDIATKSAIRRGVVMAGPAGSQGHTDQLHAIAGEADQKFPSTKPGADIHAAADSFSKGDAEGANQHLEDARMKLRGAAETKGQQSGRFGSAPVVQDSIALDNVLKMNKGQAQMMAQDQEDAARAAAKAAKKAAKAQNHAADWDDVAGVLALSAETGRLAVTPAPYGKPGGPGLYGIHGLKHSDYLEQIVHALMRKGMDKGKATAIARGSIRRWMIKSKHPEVRAAAGLAETQEIAAQARAHAHAVTWDDLGAVIDLATAPPPQQGGTLPPRVPAGSSAGGQFGAAQGSQAPKPAPKPPAKGKAPPPKGKAPAAGNPAAKGGAGKALTGVAAQKASLLATAKSDKAQAQGLIKKIIAAQAQIKALQASGAKSTAANTAATASAGKTASTSNVTASSAPAAASSTAAAASPAKAAAPAPTAASLTKQVTAWQGQVKTLMSAAAQATAKAGKL